MSFKSMFVIPLFAVVLVVWGHDSVRAANHPVFGGPADVAFAQELWQALEGAKLVGSNAIFAKPYEGQEPHGAILITLESALTVRGREGAVLVKKNYMGEGVTVESVADKPGSALDSVTVMYRREAGYDADNQNWFWAKFTANGSLVANPKGMKLAG